MKRIESNLEEPRITISVFEHLNDGPWLWVSTNLGELVRNGALRGGDELPIAHGNAYTLAIELERSLRDALLREVATSDYATALQKIRDIAADRSLLEGVPIEVDAMQDYAEWSARHGHHE